MGFRPASAAIDVARGCSSFATTIGSPFFCAIDTGVISAAKNPASRAARALVCEASAIRSCASRSMPNSVATFSAVSGIESIPYCAFISRFTKRQPIVVS